MFKLSQKLNIYYYKKYKNKRKGQVIIYFTI